METKLLSNKKSDVISGSVGRQLVSFWKDGKTYIMSEIGGTLIQDAYGESRSGGNIISFLFTKIYSNLCHWHEQEVLMETLDLFRILVSKQKVARSEKIPLWMEFPSNWMWFISNHRITHGQGAIPSVSRLDLFFGWKITFFYSSNLNSQWMQLSKQKPSKKQFNNTTVYQLVYVLSKYRGVAKHLSCIMFHWFFNSFHRQKCWKLFVNFHNVSRVSEVYMEIFQSSRSVSSIKFTLNDAQSLYLYKACIELWKLLQHNSGRIYSTKVDKETNENKYLDLLVHLEIGESDIKGFSRFSWGQTTLKNELPVVISLD